jgi:hypothetical protein
MFSRDCIESIARSAQAAASAMEERFLAIGEQLEVSTATMTALTETFAELVRELKGDNLGRATHALNDVGTEVATLAKVQRGERQSIGRLAEMTETVQGRLVRMNKALKGINTLTINTRIAAAGLGGIGDDFLAFADEIGRTLKAAQGRLERFTLELDAVDRQVSAASENQIAFDKSQGATVVAIPGQLADAVATIASHGVKAADAAAKVGAHSERVTGQIGKAVMALQIGDITRQRLEHLDFALRLATELLSADRSQGSADQNGSTPDLRTACAAIACRLQLAQLDDTVQEFEADTARILSSLRTLAADAGDILRLGTSTFGADGERRGTFLVALGEKVADVETLLEDFRTARNEADSVAASVSAAAIGLVSNLSAVQSLEADIRIMGLNTTLKCSRLGNAGRPLSVIAQELRVYAGEIATEGATVREALDGIVATATSLSTREQAGRATEIAAVAEAMTGAVGRLQGAGERLAGAFAKLEIDGEAVAGQLKAAAEKTAQNAEMGGLLRRLSQDLAATLPAAPAIDDALPPLLSEVLDRIAASYTMDRERAVHARYLASETTIPARAVPDPAPAQTAEDALADMLF